MKFFDDILQSISSNTKTKVNDPFIGAFVGSWTACNWSSLALLIWGEGNPSERIKIFNDHIKDTDFFAFNTIFTIPLIMTIVFLFLFPWISLFLKFLQDFANTKLHEQAISIEVRKTKKQEELNKARLLANPEKKFLEQNVQLEIDRRVELTSQSRARTIKRLKLAEAAEAKSAEAKSRAEQTLIEEDKKKLNLSIERQKFDLENARLKSAQASNRFPSSYNFLLTFEEALRADDIKLSLQGLGHIIATIFGYNDYHSLIHDENFNNKTLSKVKYIYYDRVKLASKLEEIIQAENLSNETLDAGTLYDYIISVLEELKFHPITDDQVEDICRAFCDDYQYNILQEEALSGPMAESDTIYDEVEIGDIQSIKFNDGFSVVFEGTTSGNHRKDDGISGRDISFTLEVKNSVVVGATALNEFHAGEVHGELVDYADDSEDGDESSIH